VQEMVEQAPRSEWIEGRQAMQEALHDVPRFREFAGLAGWSDRLPDETTILGFCHHSRKGNQWQFGMKAHIGVDAESGLVHPVRGSSGNANDVVEGNALLHGEKSEVFADAGCQGAHKRADARDGVNWHVAMRPGKRVALDKTKPVNQLIDELERLQATIRAKVEHAFWVFKRHSSLTPRVLHFKRIFALGKASMGGGA